MDNRSIAFQRTLLFYARRVDLPTKKEGVSWVALSWQAKLA
jgi:hypothetical protein